MLLFRHSPFDVGRWRFPLPIAPRSGITLELQVIIGQLEQPPQSNQRRVPNVSVNPPSISQSCDLNGAPLSSSPRPRPPNPFSEIVSHFSLFDSQFFAVRRLRRHDGLVGCLALDVERSAFSASEFPLLNFYFLPSYFLSPAALAPIAPKNVLSLIAGKICCRYQLSPIAP